MSELDICLFGLNHDVAPVELREKAAFATEEIPQLLNALTVNYGFSEACVLSTCNRSEFFVLAERSMDVPNSLQTAIRQFKPQLQAEDFQAFYFYRQTQAIDHLFAVASGLNSMILGEPQILGQVKEAFRLASESSAAGVYLNHLFEHAIQTAKRVRSETAIGEGAVSVAYAAVELAQKIFKDLRKQKILLIGSGETGQLVARHLKKKEVEKIYFTNRTFEKAKILADQLGGIVFPYPLMRELLPEMDLIIGSTNAKDFILTAEDLRKILPCRKPKPLFMIDIALPRDFDPAIKQFDNIFLNDIDSLQRIVDQNLAKRKAEVRHARKILAEEIDKFEKWRNSLQLTPTIVSLRKKLEHIRELEVKKYQHRASPEELEVIDRVTRGILNKILHLPMVQLKRYSNGHQDGLRRLDVVREIFDLEDDLHD